MNDAVLGISIKNVRKNRDIKLVATEERRNYLVSEPNYHTKFFLKKKKIANKQKKTFMNKAVYLSLSIYIRIK